MQTTYLKDYTPPDFLIDSVHCHFEIEENDIIVKSLLRVRRNAASKNQKADLVLDGEALILQQVALNGKILPAEKMCVTNKTLTILNVSDTFSLETTVQIFPKKNTTLMGLYQSRNNLCTQCEAEGFRRITYFLDRPDVMSRFTVTISADKDRFPFLLSNGNLVEERLMENNRHWVHWEDPSLKPCYLFALVAGDFDVIRDQFETMHERHVDLYLYLEKGFLDQGDYAMIALKKAMKWDEEKFGREYDLDRFMIVAVSDFNMGAMENKGLNIFNTKYILAKPETATDADYINIERVIAHEYFHNWTGDRVTCRDWFQLTLKEGLTVCRDQLFTEDTTSKGVARIDVVNTLRNHQFPEDAGPMAHPIRPDSYVKIDNFYTATVYEKGAEVIRMARTLLSPDGFRKGMDLYFSRYDGHAVTTEDFLQALADANQFDFSQFSRWYHQAGTPIVQVKTQYDVAKKTFHVHIKQMTLPTPHQFEKLPLYFPFEMALIDSHCHAMELQLEHESHSFGKSTVLTIQQSEETFTFIHVAEKPAPSLLRHFSAPVILHYDYSNDELARLMQCDTDAFCRWEAGQRLMVNAIGDAARNADVTADLLIHSVESLLKNPPSDLNMLTRLLQFPSLKYLYTQLKPLDIDAVFRAEQLVEKALAKQLVKLFSDLFEKNKVTNPEYSVEACGQRAIRAASLYYLMHANPAHYAKIAFHDAQHATTMTDKLGALIALNHHVIDERETALTQFYEHYHREPLVVNKWFSLQASSTLPDTLQRVKSLLQHPAFDWKNPNNVYALLVTFGSNTLRFHDASGEAYEFLTDCILKIDANNPIVAARVVQPFSQWKQMDKSRGALMKAQLERLSSQKLSDNLREIVAKSLE
ncbi:MAG: aminopeptidase N [Gammaproteobacteria bacterium RIFCSPLOWO2_02_FULL_42_14]|nr:MAG: aminopeptidase N [Gammaproteobacteria bacterium RIFCSPHIGHO2_02_FULL_42_43]OGT51207.1 MAG: aminopeptidase N [Gammaproteobacteria bacterium RIFCSPHIGHO2_12_FULL_41_25]OGT62968.1 MAG: aminopeptidase N [Gammaproteobacteria bacterium RIFCSPLOWO2_02_FULL_42_14]OGT86101.1 MAG: aminopeptidase N [Gammaproteobacteria bacterium RIFCSPLOWO2_12_FULL_42_18]